MGRLPFDPAKMAGASARPPAAVSAPSGGDGGITVSQLCARIDQSLRDGLPPTLRVVGEIGQFRERMHWYFDLKDEAAIISCVMFASVAAKSGGAGGPPKVGDRVIVTGRVEFFAKQGRTQFYVTKLEPVGEGALDAALRRLVEEARALGWLDPARKRPIPTFPRRIAVITSRTGAALQDVLDTMRRRCPAVGIALLDVRVQGDGAAPEIARALAWVGRNREKEGLDAVLLTRGGGSKQDLWAFNEREVAEAVVRCPLPVVAAIGHETDTSLAELVADERAATPTQAAMRLTPDTGALNEQLDSLTGRLVTDLRRRTRHETDRLGAARRALFVAPRARLADARASVDRLAARLERHRPAAVYAQRASRVRELTISLQDAMRERLAVDTGALASRMSAAIRAGLIARTAAAESAARALELVGPVGVLRRGYSATLTESGAAVRSITDVAPGDRLTTRVADGSFRSVVGDDPRPAERPLPPRLLRRPRATDTTGGLFEG